MRHFRHGAATATEGMDEIEADKALTVQEFLEFLQTIPLAIRMVSFIRLPDTSYDTMEGKLTRRLIEYDKELLQLSLEGDPCAESPSR